MDWVGWAQGKERRAERRKANIPLYAFVWLGPAPLLTAAAGVATCALEEVGVIDIIQQHGPV